MRKFLAAFLFLASVVLGSAAPSWAADLSGTWQLDRKASDSPEELLQAQGVGFMKRKAAAGLDVTQNITQEGDQLTIQTVTSANTKTDTIEVDGETRSVQGKRGTAKVRHEWRGEVLVTTSTMPMKDGEGQIVTQRSLSDDGKTLTQRIELTRPDGSKVSLNRIFRKP